MVLDLLEALGAGVVVERIEGDDGVRQIVEQSLEMFMKQRQPVLHALMLAPGRDRLVERIIAGDGPEQLDVAGTKALARLIGERRFAHRQERDLIETRKRSLRLG